MKVQLGSFTFNVLYEGNPTDPLVVLSHALMSNLHLWDSTAQALQKAGYSTIRYDHVGHGLTSRPTKDQIGNLHFDNLCRDINGIVESVAPGKTPFAIIGCSMGGVLAIRYALLYPGKVKKIVSCGAPGMDSLEQSKGPWLDRIDNFRANGVAPLAQATPFPPGTRDEALEHTLSCTLQGYEACVQGIMNYKYGGELHKIQTEDVMVLIGEKDTAIGPKEVSIDIAAGIKGARFVEVSDCGHIPPMHRSEEFEDLIVDFLGA